jgi:DNA-binding MarR family transcriptional regulator
VICEGAEEVSVRLNGERIMRKSYIGILQDCERSLQMKILSKEYEVVSCLFDQEAASPKDLFRRSSASGTRFFAILENLESRGVVASRENPADGRGRLYFLTDASRAIIEGQWERYRSEGYEQLYLANDPSETLKKYAKTIRSGLKIKHFTCEFQILLYLHASPGIRAMKFTDLVDVSKTTFNHRLMMLIERRHIYFERDPTDGRSKLYRISPQTFRVLDVLNRDVREWLDARARFLSAVQSHGSSQDVDMSAG